jgi:hypothetical protein
MLTLYIHGIWVADGAIQTQRYLYHREPQSLYAGVEQVYVRNL